MIELVFMACIAGAPDACEERSMIFYDVTPMACMMGAQPELAKWVNSHPDYAIASWRCQTPGAGGEEV